MRAISSLSINEFHKTRKLLLPHATNLSSLLEFTKTTQYIIAKSRDTWHDKTKILQRGFISHHCWNHTFSPMHLATYAGQTTQGRNPIRNWMSLYKKVYKRIKTPDVQFTDTWKDTPSNNNSSALPISTVPSIHYKLFWCCQNFISQSPSQNLL